LCSCRTGIKNYTVPLLNKLNSFLSNFFLFLQMSLIEQLSGLGKRPYSFQKRTSMLSLDIPHLFQGFQILTDRYILHIENFTKVLNFCMSFFTNQMQYLYSSLIECHIY